jgi:ATP-dependent DNA ligase
MEIVFSTDLLTSNTKSGNIKCWQGHVSQEGENFFTYSSYYQILSNGEKSVVQNSDYYPVISTNVGRSNERSGLEQAKFNIIADMKLKQDKGYVIEGNENPPMTILPMLANKFGKMTGKYIKNPCYQRKENGFRLLMCNKKAWSRNGKELGESFPHLLIDTKGVVLDGELLLPEGYTFQETCEAIKKTRETSLLLEYRVFDIVDTTKTFSERYQYLLDNFSNIPGIKIVETYIDTLDKAPEYLNRFIQEGFEGLIIRDLNSYYEVNHRSQYLVKYKNFLDAEFKIVGVSEGQGGMAGCAILTCELPNGNTVDCVPKGTIEYKKELWDRKEELIGKYLTIRFQCYTDEGSLLFPVGLCLRDEIE